MSDGQILKGQFAVVTGGSRGIGRAVAETLAEHGCNVAIAARNKQHCQDTAAEIASRLHVQTLGAACDISLKADVMRLFQEIRPWSGGRLDILVCNAGYPFVEEIWNTPLDATPPEKLEAWYLDIFRTDTFGAVLCTLEALPLMLARKSGSIIYVSSTPALEGYQGTPYTIAKAGILGLMKDIASEYGRFNIRANALALGNIETLATSERLDIAARRSLAEEAPLKRWGLPEEVARVALFLASNLSSFVTGQTIVVDGGTLRR